jgi:HD-GYP domain-containing protein (c-di-GMP phosphodiesterase class II)
MEALLRERLASVLAMVAAAAVLPAAILHFFWNQEAHFTNTFHFAMIAIGAGTATFAAIALTIVGARRNDGRTVLLGTAFTVMSGILVIHGLATPGIIVGMNGVVGLSGAATLPVGGAILALSALPSLRNPHSVRKLLILEAVLFLAVIALGVVGLTDPDFVPNVPETGSTEAIVLLAAGLLFYGVLTVRAARTYALTRRARDFMVVAGLVWLALALFSQLLVDYTSVAWWIGHGLELVGVAMVGIPVALDLRCSAPSRPLTGDLKAAELVAAEEGYLGARVRSLLVRLAEKDAYTEHHTRRVALRAVQVGEELGLSPGRLRSLATGGLLHDIGKLAVADEILQKPGPLDDREYAVIRGHPQAGYVLLDELGGFPMSMRRLVRDHHERLDGGGYPSGLPADRINLETRILTACDVYDALRSDRVYREAWSHERAMELLHDECGTAFDPRCVAALERVLAREGVRQREAVTA